jgi:sulfite reductase (NADPH) flavoprotein alpha-component
MSNGALENDRMADGEANCARWRAIVADLTLRKILFRLHWLLGISVGLVLAFMGITGAMMSFEDEIMDAVSPQARVQISSSVPLSPDSLLKTIHAQLPQDKVTALQVERDPGRAYTITVLRRPADGGRNPRIFINPYDGKLLGEATGADFFGRVRSLHRYLTASGGSNDIGRHITGIAAFSVIFFGLSGLYLRWPKRPFDWRSWFRLDFSMRGRALYRSLHSVIGSWVVIFYVISALSGLWWSYDWYRDVVTSLLSPETEVVKPRKQTGATLASEAFQPAGPVEVDRVLATVRAEYGARFANVGIILPQFGRPARVRVLTTDASHDRALDNLQIDPVTGKVTGRELYAELSPGEWIMANMDPIHTGIVFGPVWRIMVFFAALGLPFFAVTGLLLYVDRRRSDRRVSRSSPAAMVAGVALASGPLIVFASQTGAAEQLARQAAGSFHATGIGARLVSISDISPELLRRESQVLFVVSTYGNGHAPDSAGRFESRIMRDYVQLTDLRYGLLALGDRRHADFCAFGRRLNAWLLAGSAKPMFPLVYVDAHDPEALSEWGRCLETMGAAPRVGDQSDVDFEPWVVEHREVINPGSVGSPVFRIRLVRKTGSGNWQPGDIAEILPGPMWTPHETLREYSIASIADDEAIVLIVRQVFRSDGSLGLGSGWLAALAPVGSVIPLRIRSNKNFHAPSRGRPMILIGNGTGIAGLHAHLRHRTTQMPTENWLIFGERNESIDFLLRKEISELQCSGVLQRLTTAFSRDQQERIYVQHRIGQEAAELRRWVDRGAAIYVCGSSDTMAPAVDAELRLALGADCMEVMTAQGLYRRDIY